MRPWRRHILPGLAAGPLLRRVGKESLAVSVASFFVSRVDIMSIPCWRKSARRKARSARQNRHRQRQTRLSALSRNILWGTFAALREKGARCSDRYGAAPAPKNPAYSDVLYVEELIGPDTVNTVPPKTLQAFRDHGHVHHTLQEDIAQAKTDIAQLAKSGDRSRCHHRKAAR